jgi:hypothetical protein
MCGLTADSVRKLSGSKKLVICMPQTDPFRALDRESHNIICFAMPVRIRMARAGGLTSRRFISASLWPTHHATRQPEHG